MEKDNLIILCIIIIIAVLGTCALVFTQATSNSSTVNNTTNNTNLTANTTNVTNDANNQTVSSSKSNTHSGSGSSQGSNLEKDENSEVYGSISHDSDGNEYWTGQGDDGGVYTSRNGATSDGGYNHDGVHYDSSGNPACSAAGIY